MLDRRELLRRGLLTASAWSVPAITALSTRPVCAGRVIPSFQGLGELPHPGAEEAATEADGVSADGSVVVGHREIIIPNDGGSFGTFQQPFRWTPASGYELLGEAIPNQARAAAASADGSVVVGYAGGGFRWSATSGLQQLPLRTAEDVSADGSIVLGGNLIWSEAGGTIEMASEGAGFGLSADGQAAAGYIRSHAFRWSAAGGLQDIHPRRRVWESLARDISGDGRVVVGQAMFRRWAPWHAFRWSPTKGMVDLGTLAGPQSWAFGTNGDGKVVVGISEGPGNRGGAFRWTPWTGMRALRSELLKAGVEAVRAWNLTIATGVSGDGTVIVGMGRNPAGRREAFRAVLPLPKRRR